MGRRRINTQKFYLNEKKHIKPALTNEVITIMENSPLELPGWNIGDEIASYVIYGINSAETKHSITTHINLYQRMEHLIHNKKRELKELRKEYNGRI